MPRLACAACRPVSIKFRDELQVQPFNVVLSEGLIANHVHLSDRRLSDAASFTILGETELQALCGSTCQNDLGRLRTAVTSACTASEDVMVPNGVAYPGMFRYMYRAVRAWFKRAVLTLRHSHVPH
jgi:hypothetical protein